MIKNTERIIARYLERFPRLRKSIKSLNRKVRKIFFSKPSEIPSNHLNLGELLDREVFSGYYDRSPWSPGGSNYILYSPTRNGLEIIIYNIYDKTYMTIDESKAWNWQQGALAAWIDDESIIFNQIDNDTIFSKIINIKTKEERILPMALQSVSSNRLYTYSLNINKLTELRPDYGFDLIDGKFEGLGQNNDGIWETNIASGVVKLIVSIGQCNVAVNKDYAYEKSKINHIVSSPDSLQICFLYRSITEKSKNTHLMIYDINQERLFEIPTDHIVSHYCWLDSAKLMVWCQKDGKLGYFIANVHDLTLKYVGNTYLESIGDGHPSGFGCDSIITDSYPDITYRQHLLLYNFNTKDYTVLAKLDTSLRYVDEKRCDLHPKVNLHHRQVSIDAVISDKRTVLLLKL